MDETLATQGWGPDLGPLARWTAASYTSSAAHSPSTGEEKVEAAQSKLDIWTGWVKKLWGQKETLSQ